MSKRQKAKDLIELALDDTTSLEERQAAAMRAVKLIRKYDLLESPLDALDMENDTVKAVKSVAEVVLDPSLRKNVRKIANQLGRIRRR